MPFLSDLKAHYDADKETITLITPLEYRSYRHGVTISVPIFFTCNGASIPISFVSVIGLHPFSDGIIEAGCLHDYLYRTDNQFSRKEIDQIFYDAMREEGKIGWFRAQLIWKAVRLFGSKRRKNAIYH